MTLPVAHAVSTVLNFDLEPEYWRDFDYGMALRLGLGVLHEVGVLDQLSEDNSVPACQSQ